MLHFVVEMLNFNTDRWFWIFLSVVFLNTDYVCFATKKIEIVIKVLNKNYYS